MIDKKIIITIVIAILIAVAIIYILMVFSGQLGYVTRGVATQKNLPGIVRGC